MKDIGIWYIIDESYNEKIIENILFYFDKYKVCNLYMNNRLKYYVIFIFRKLNLNILDM